MCWQLCATFSFPPKLTVEETWQHFLSAAALQLHPFSLSGLPISLQQPWERFLLGEVDDIQAPHPCKPSISGLVSWRSCFQFCALSMGWRSRFVVSGQSLAEHGLKNQPFPLLWLYRGSPKSALHKKAQPQFPSLFLQRSPRTTAEPVSWLTLTWKRNMHSGWPGRTHGILIQQCEF